MIVTEWKDFGTDAQFYTQDGFEKEVGDKFEAACFNESNEVPNYIWTTKHVVVIKNNTRMINDVSFVKIPRHPIEKSC
ncbi:hypothetical protein SAMN05421734_10583 [Pelagirhabdus alkalitolerans]|uniref:Uncharacterized protein n=1 Tax=Pelagirhabdus alkalitolerans TaxID=1612202 RepID=A0A1G6JLS5_9BACI|nr:hypothetical protein [Pelagirhabdus alkalitolerans]SDC19618.1 hypothetical protein SAMN05421734_10583 [Pelagirhabdus alkalitolerans]